MDVSFANAIRNASAAWANNRTTDVQTMQELTKRYVAPTHPVSAAATPSASHLAVIQPELARYGQVGTKLNIYA